MEVEVKRIMMCYIHVSTPHDECNRYVLQTYTNKNFEKCLDQNVYFKRYYFQ